MVCVLLLRIGGCLSCMVTCLFFLLTADLCYLFIRVVARGRLSPCFVLAIVCSLLHVRCWLLLVVDVACCLLRVVVRWLLSVECCCVTFDG